MQQEFDGVEIIVRLHEQRADVLVHPGERQPVFFEQGADFIQRGGIDAEFGFLSGGDDLFVMPGPDAGVDADHHLAAGVDLAILVELRQGIHADDEAVVHGVFHFFGGNIVTDVQEAVGREPGQLVDMQFAGRHGVGVAAFFTDDAQEGGVRVGFGGIVYMEPRKAGKAEQIPAALAQHVFIIDVERGAVLGGKFLRRRVSKKAGLVGLDGANVWHGLSSEWQKITG